VILRRRIAAPLTPQVHQDEAMLALTGEPHARLLKATPMPAWRAYLRWRVLSEYSPCGADRCLDRRGARKTLRREVLSADRQGSSPSSRSRSATPRRGAITRRLRSRFPAGILQPPFFVPAADDAVNYGAIGQTIGHEISHAFDDWGSQYDGDGNLLDPPGWFTAPDLERFRAKSRVLVAQYAAYSPVPGYPINGELTLGENIADNAGLAVAYRAYLLSLNGREPAVIDGFTGAQRFFLGYAQSYLGKTRDSEAILAIESDPHSPDRFRGMLPEMNLSAFHEAFDTRPGDRMYRPPAERITLW
jgi:predicted metalloendopeptidase